MEKMFTSQSFPVRFSQYSLACILLIALVNNFINFFKFMDANLDPAIYLTQGVTTLFGLMYLTRYFLSIKRKSDAVTIYANATASIMTIIFLPYVIVQVIDLISAIDVLADHFQFSLTYPFVKFAI